LKDYMRGSQRLKEFLEEVEGLRLTVYKDSGGFKTIGIGHLLIRSEIMSGKIETSEETIRYQDRITKEQARDILDDDLRDAEAHVNESVKVVLSQNQFDALVSFCFNVGGTAFASSTLVRQLNEWPGLGFDLVPFQLRRWNRIGEKISNGLKNRREKEVALWEGRY